MNAPQNSGAEVGIAEHTVSFTPVGISNTVETGVSVLDAARRVGVDLSSVCGGRQTCRRCVVEIDGEATLACATRVSGNLLVQVPESSTGAMPVVRKTIDSANADIDPRFPLVAAGQGFGIAIDVGSTTIAAHLCDLFTGEVIVGTGKVNPQIRYGDDLMSRVSYAMMNPGGADQLTAAVRQALEEVVQELVSDAQIEGSQVLEIVLVANPVMHHLVLGYDPIPLGMAPFPLHTDQSVTGLAAELGINLDTAEFYFAPCIAGHVGADTAGAILAEGPHRSEGVQLLVDIGTNAEIVLGNREQVFAASSPTGPAFEGAEISDGQRAAPGAIERVRIDPATKKARFKVIGHEHWSDSEAFDATVTGICGSGIIEAIAEMFLAGVMDGDGVILGELAASDAPVVVDGRTFAYILYDHPDHPIRIIQNDVRAIQLAKAALRAGIELLLEHAGRPSIGAIRLAGAFGAHIDPHHAIELGLIPRCEPRQVAAVGNAAGVGAVRALLSMAARAEMEQAVAEVIKIETATEPRFQELFVAAMAIPHAEDPSYRPSVRQRETGSRRRRRRV